jgi:hypothetical protein
MPSTIVHHTISIITLAAGEVMLEHCQDGDIALVQQEDGWWVNFIGEDGAVDGYETPFDSYNKALGTAKAAAEYSAE